MKNEEKLLEENKKLKAQLKRAKAKLQPKESFVLQNLDQFGRLLEEIKGFQEDGKTRYFFTRKAKGSDKDEEVFKTNVFVQDLLEVKARANVEEDQVNSRISMDQHSLITFLSKGRVKRPRKQEDKTSKPKATPTAQKTPVEELEAMAEKIDEKIDQKKAKEPKKARFQGEGDVDPPYLGD